MYTLVPCTPRIIPFKQLHSFNAHDLSDYKSDTTVDEPFLFVTFGRIRDGWYLQHAHFIPIVGVEKKGAYYLVYGDLPRQHPFGTTRK